MILRKHTPISFDKNYIFSPSIFDRVETGHTNMKIRNVLEKFIAHIIEYYAHIIWANFFFIFTLSFLDFGKTFNVSGSTVCVRTI